MLGALEDVAGGLMDRHGPRLFGLAIRLVGNRTDAEDVLQETFAAAFSSARQFRGQSSVGTWLTRILVIQAAVARRKRQRWRMETAQEPPASPADAAEAAEARMDVQEVLQRLSDEHRQVLVLREFGHLGYEEIAEVLGVPRGTVESRLHRARGELKVLLAAYLTT